MIDSDHNNNRNLGDAAEDTRKVTQQQMDGPAAEMPRYLCHKKVWALKIESIARDAEAAQREGRETDGSAIIYPSEMGYAPFRVDGGYVRKHNPQAGGYYVVYDDGYKSFSPAKAFEDGYERIK